MQNFTFKMTHRALSSMKISRLGAKKLLASNHKMNLFPSSNLSTSNEPRSKFKAVIFDFGGVFVPSPMHSIRKIEQKFHLEPLAFGKALVNSKEFEELEKGALDLEEFIEASKNSFKKIVPKEKWREVVYEIFGHVELESPEYQIVYHAANALRADGLKTALLTNNWMLNKTSNQGSLPIERNMFTIVIESCRVGMRKPDPEIFAHTLKQLDVCSEDTIFVDDLGHNLKAAGELGIHTIKAESPSQVVRDLETLLSLPLHFFVKGTVAPSKHVQLPLKQLREYLEKNVGITSASNGELPLVRQFVNGRSNPTYFVKYGNEKLVLRRKPPGKLLPSAHAIDREYKLYKGLAASDVPVPNMRAYCQDLSVIGSEFYVMDYIEGVVYKDLTCKSIFPLERRRKLYSEMNQVLAAVHSVDLDNSGLSDWGKRDTSYLERNLNRWVKQYEMSQTEDHISMNKLIAYLKNNYAKMIAENELMKRVTLVHGDFRLDNLIFDKNTDEVLSVIDWELSTVGDPFTDLATSIFHYYVPSVFNVFSGMSDIDKTGLNLPTLSEHILEYFKCSNLKLPENFDPVDFMKFYVAFCIFRYAAIAQGVYKRAISGQSASPGSEMFGKAVPLLAGIALKIIGEEVPKKSASLASEGICLEPNAMRPKAKEIYYKLDNFISKKLAPLEKELLKFYEDLQTCDNRWSTVHPALEELKQEAKNQGLWNLWLCKDLDPDSKFNGAGLTNVEYAHMAEMMGRYQPFGPELFNCAAPDTGNMEVLIKYGTKEQQDAWLYKLLSGEVRSAFAMTEPAVASSDATNISASIRREGDDLVLNGRKWWTSGIMNPKCEVIIYLGKSHSLASNPRHKQHSMVLVPRYAPGVKVVRPLSVFGYDDSVHGGHGEVVFENVRVNAKQSLLLDEGRGFEIGQGRLGPGRIHHCMRLIGMSARAIDLAMERASSRVAFQRPLAMRDSVQMELAKSLAELEQARLLVLKASHMIDTVGAKASSMEIAMIKAVVPATSQRIIDRAIQIHGAAGVSQDFPLAGFMAGARALRLADGPDEVHWRTVARIYYKQQMAAKETGAKL